MIGIMSGIGERISKLRKIVGINTQQMLSEKLSVSRGLVSMWESDRSTPTTEDAMRLARLFNVSIDYLLWGGDKESQTGIVYTSNIRRVPVVGIISCGAPLLADQHIDEYINLPADLAPGSELIALRMRGDSMEGARLYNGTIALIALQASANNGDIVAVCVGEAQNEATIKKIRIEGGYATLIPMPSAGNEDAFLPTCHLASQITIIGRVVGVWWG